ncbi:P-loop containing nucleoside triphosphate hydrolase protein [Cercophora newfieldiana]|uniref:P-loop containing nucleoside triphosphate hydrolase protein n=1 Tax=Cercophora newfieldiana TaxID=92897 RepID=A0AA39YEC8_9PEZI|nr:P-loop containing nucleoside triphosphate hydrolase protein [Cercophora newfieldiana]
MDPETHSRLTSRGDHGCEKLAIILMGVTGSGKSTFISLLTRQNVEVGHGLESHTTTPASYIFTDDSKEITLIDTPGFDDTTRSDVEIFRELAHLLIALHKSNIRPCGIVYLHRITDPRFSGTAVKNLEILQRVCGPANFGSVALVMNMWDAIDVSAATQRESELRSTFWATMLDGGSIMHRHTGTPQSALRIIRSLTHNAEPHLVLSLQHELVVEGKALDATAGGQYVQKEMIKARKKHEQDVAFLKRSMEDAIREKDEGLLRALREERSAAEAKLSSAALENQQLSVTLEQLLMQEDHRKASRVLFEDNGTQPPPRLPQPEYAPATSEFAWRQDPSHLSSPVRLDLGRSANSPSAPPWVHDNIASKSLDPQCERQLKLQCEQEKLQASIHDAEREFQRLKGMTQATPQRPKPPVVSMESRRRLNNGARATTKSIVEDLMDVVTDGVQALASAMIRGGR